MSDFNWGDGDNEILNNVLGSEESPSGELDYEFEKGESLMDEEPQKKEVEQPKPQKKQSIYKDVYKDLRDKKIFKHTEIGDDEDIDADRLSGIYEEEFDREVKKRLNDWAKTQGSDFEKLINYKLNGGDLKKFLKTIENTLPMGDISDESYQDYLIRTQLAREGWEADEIEDRLEYLTDRGTKRGFAEKYMQKFMEEDELRKERLVKEQEEAVHKELNQYEAFKQDLKNNLNENSEISGFKFPPKEKTAIYNFITVRDSRLNGKTGFQAKLEEAIQDKNKILVLAKLLKNNFDMNSYNKNIATKETRKFKSNLENRKGLGGGSSGSGSFTGSLEDFFNLD